MPIRYSPRPIRALRNSAFLFYAELAAKGTVATAFLAILSLTPAN